jgi:hypothetical protein
MTRANNFQNLQIYPQFQNVYFWSLILAAAAQPVGALVSFFVHLKTLISVGILSFICFVCSLIFLIISLQSPHPMFQGHWFGGVFVVSFRDFFTKKYQ